MTTDPSITQLLIAAGVAAVGFMQTMILTRQNRHGEALDKIGGKVGKLEGWAFGPTNSNGANGDIKQAQKDIQDLKQFTGLGRRASDVA